MLKSILIILYFVTICVDGKPPNIVLIVADDLGYNDVSWHNPDILSPNLASLAQEGIILENNYVQPICTPTRSALMTGYYPIHTGRQWSVLWPQEPVGLKANFTLMPEYLKQLGYKTHMVGKWHLGFCNKAYLPTRRGFDTFNGFWLGSQDYYKHTRGASEGPAGYDFRDNESVDKVANGTYSSFVFADHSSRLINSHASNHSKDPFFLYLALQDTHGPLQVPKEYEELYPNITNKYRRTFSGMVSAMDDAVGKVVKSLKQNGMYEDTIILFTADNGGQTLAGGNNYPLRGNKGTLWEGGTRAASFIHAPFIKKNKGTVNKGLIHVTDWLPTFITAAGGDPSSLLGPIDGVDQWQSLVSGSPSFPRTEMLYNINPKRDGDILDEAKNPERDGYKLDKANAGAALRIGEMKLLVGDGGSPDGWIRPERVLGSKRQVKESLDFVSEMSSKGFECLQENEVEEGDKYKFPWHQIQLFNLTSDPEERHNIASAHPHIVLRLISRLREFYLSMVPPDVKPATEAGNPNNFGGIFSTGWCDVGTEKEEEKEGVTLELMK